MISFAIASKILLPASIKPAEAFGYPGGCPTWSPSTLTFLGKVNGDTASQVNYLATADEWQSKVASWTFTTSGSIGDGKYFERIDDNGNPNDGHLLYISNRGGVHDERSIVDSSFLELIRLGVKPWNDFLRESHCSASL